jgi:hypothetical protein
MGFDEYEPSTTGLQPFVIKDGYSITHLLQACWGFQRQSTQSLLSVRRFDVLVVATLRLVMCPYRPALRLCWKAIRLSSKLKKDGSQRSMVLGLPAFLA